ncbi:MAG: hypothetical protein MPJ08_08870 [Nitrosopumilus sp.]|nr:hypothetical protein [Nitrosopumilus sp.]
MNTDDLFSQVRITSTGAICLGGSIVCDGFAPGMKAAAFTHIHTDHISNDFERCLHRYDVYVTKMTFKMLEALENDSYRRRRQLYGIDTEEPIAISHDSGSEHLTMYRSNHMLGAAQILYTKNDKLKILYSGDIAAGDSPPKCNVLVLDSTHGNPTFDKKINKYELDQSLLETVHKALENKKPVRVHAHRGELQYIMHLLTTDRRIPHESTPFLCLGKDIRLATIYSNNGMKIRKSIDIESDAGKDIRGDGQSPYVEFTTSFNRSISEESGKIISIFVSGRPGDKTITKTNDTVWIASRSHMEFSEILDYVKNASPEVVVTDNYRTGSGRDLADHIRGRLGIKARSCP